MSDQPPPIDELARTYARTAGEGFKDAAQYLASLPEHEWNGPTACTRWTVHDLAGHIVGEAVWFPNLARGVTEGEPPLPNDLYEAMKTWPPDRLVDALTDAADQIWTTIDAATTDQLHQPVDLGFTKMPLWRATCVSAGEATLHNWDARAPRQPGATIPAEWAVPVALGWTEAARFLVNRKGSAEASGTYLLRVADGIGPVTVHIHDGNVDMQRGNVGTPTVMLHLTADQYLRLLWGRFDIARAVARGELTVEGDPDRARGLNRVFQGV